MTKLIALGDTHCGHKVGLTPPEFWSNRPDWRAQQQKLWTHFTDGLARFGKPDIVIANGDLIDGLGKSRSSVEHTEYDWDRQCEMAIHILGLLDADQYYMTYGTPFHVSNNGSQEEKKIADAVGADIRGHLWLDVEGVTFDVKHKIGSSSIPHGRTSALMKAVLWNQRQAQEGIQPRADVLLRSHVHYHVFAGDSETLGMTLPALQGAGSKYGEEQCEGIVDFGMVCFECSDGAYTWEADSTKLMTTYEKLTAK